MARPLLTVIEGSIRSTYPGQKFDPSKGGYSILYRKGQPNPCPGCGRSQWYVGRQSAECAFCGVALPFAPIRPQDDL